MDEELITPNLEWARKVAREHGVETRCPYAHARKCPRYFESLSLLGKAGRITAIPKRDEEALLRYWRGSQLWPEVTEKASAMSGSEDHKSFTNFCPEVSFDHFGYFASALFPYGDDLDLEVGIQSWAKKPVGPGHWYPIWSAVTPSHYTDCPLYSLIKTGGQREGVMPEATDQALVRKIAVVAKDHYSLRTIDDLFIFAGATPEAKRTPLASQGGERMDCVYGWVRISAHSDTQFGFCRTPSSVSAGHRVRAPSDTGFGHRRTGGVGAGLFAFRGHGLLPWFLGSLVPAGALLPPHGRALQGDPVGVMDEPIQDRIAKSRIANQVMPVFEGELAGHEGGPAVVAVLEDFEQVASFEVAEGGQAPVVEDEEVGLGERCEAGAIGAVGAREGEVLQEAREADVAHPQPVAAGAMAQGTGEIGLARAGRADEQDDLMLADPVATGEAEEDGAIEPARGLEVEVFHRGGEAQGGQLEQAGEAAIGAGCDLAFEEQGEAIFEGEGVEIGLAPLLIEGLGHAGEAEFVQAVNRLLEQHGFLLGWR